MNDFENGTDDYYRMHRAAYWPVSAANYDRFQTVNRAGEFMNIRERKTFLKVIER